MHVNGFEIPRRSSPNLAWWKGRGRSNNSVCPTFEYMRNCCFQNVVGGFSLPSIRKPFTGKRKLIVNAVNLWLVSKNCLHKNGVIMPIRTATDYIVLLVHEVSSLPRVNVYFIYSYFHFHSGLINKIVRNILCLLAKDLLWIVTFINRWNINIYTTHILVETINNHATIYVRHKFVYKFFTY